MRCTSAVAFFAVVVAGSASSPAKAQTLSPQVGQQAPDRFKKGEAYQLSKEELALDCKRLTGKMQIRILQARDAGVRPNSTAIARGIQSVVTPLLGGTTHGASVSNDAARKLAVLEAMNRQLAAKNCATFDLESELQPRSLRDTPAPVPKTGTAAKAN